MAAYEGVGFFFLKSLQTPFLIDSLRPNKVVCQFMAKFMPVKALWGSKTQINVHSFYSLLGLLRPVSSAALTVFETH